MANTDTLKCNNHYVIVFNLHNGKWYCFASKRCFDVVCITFSWSSTVSVNFLEFEKYNGHHKEWNQTKNKPVVNPELLQYLEPESKTELKFKKITILILIWSNEIIQVSVPESPSAFKWADLVLSKNTCDISR